MLESRLKKLMRIPLLAHLLRNVRLVKCQLGQNTRNSLNLLIGYAALEATTDETAAKSGDKKFHKQRPEQKGVGRQQRQLFICTRAI